MALTAVYVMVMKVLIVAIMLEKRRRIVMKLIQYLTTLLGMTVGTAGLVPMMKMMIMMMVAIMIPKM